MTLVWTAGAAERVVEMGEAIARDQPIAAADWIERILTSVERLKRFPLSGRVVPDDYREVVVAGVRVVYRVRPEAVVIVAVRHSREMLDPDSITKD